MDTAQAIKIRAGLGESTVLADIDFETYSEAGFIWDGTKYIGLPNASKKGLPGCGLAVYAEHPSTEVLSCAYDLKDGKGKRLWTPELPCPLDLMLYIAKGGLIEAWNVAFERWIWNKVCVPKYKWLPLKIEQTRDAMAKARAYALPGSLGACGEVLNIQNAKLKDGKRLIEKFSMPRTPTKADPRTRIHPHEDPIDQKKLYEYNFVDIMAEAEISSLVPDLNADEQALWLCDQTINDRGVQIDIPIVKQCIKIIERAYEKYNEELSTLTGGAVKAASEVQRIRQWLLTYEISTLSLDSDAVESLLSQQRLVYEVRRVLEIRKSIGSSAVKKLYAMLNQSSRSGRLHELFIYHSARTGRAAGAGAQPQNLPNSGPHIAKCDHCARYFGLHHDLCIWCGMRGQTKQEWNAKAVNDAILTLSSGSLELTEWYWGDAVEVVSGCLRGMFVAAEGCDLICSDYASIEAVCLAELAGEQWQIDVFKTHGKIYEATAAAITGKTVEYYIQYKNETGSHHADRKIGKLACLSSGYGGWVGAWKQFGADDFFSNDEEIKKAILAWRAANPNIVEYWGGQERNWQPGFYGLEGAAIQAVSNPGTEYSYRGIKYIVLEDTLYCTLLSGRHLTYHHPRLEPSERRPGTLSLSFEGWNSNPIAGVIGWTRMYTYAGKLTENIVQATARDILAHAIVVLEAAGYPIVLHVHDEIVAEVPEGYGSVENFERLMSTLPAWAAGWPVRAQGGWRSKRYGK